jgi:hypothetical protein
VGFCGGKPDLPVPAGVLKPSFAVLRLQRAVSGFSKHGAGDGWARQGWIWGKKLRAKLTSLALSNALNPSLELFAGVLMCRPPQSE